MALRSILLLSFIVASMPACFLRPFYGIVLWVIIAFLNPQAYVWAGAANIQWALLVAVPTLLGFLVFTRGWPQRLESREGALLALLWIWFTVTTVISTHTGLFLHHAASTKYRWEFVSKVLLMTVVTVGVVDSFDRLRKLVITIAACFGFYVVKALPFMIATGGGQRIYGPEQSMIADNNDFGLALNMTLPLFFFLAQTETKRWAKLLFRFLFVVTIPAVFFTYSRGALLGLITVTLMMLLRSRQRLVLIPVIGIGILIAGVFTPESWRHRMDPTRDDAVDASARSRINSWTYSWRLALDYPIAGGGFDTFTQPLFDRYAPNTGDLHGPHSVYFGVLAEHGFVGLFLYLSLTGSVFWATHKIVKNAQFDENREMFLGYGNMIRFGMVGFLVSGTFLGRAYFDYYFTLMACAMILKNVYRVEAADAAAEFEPDACEAAEPLEMIGGEI